MKKYLINLTLLVVAVLGYSQQPAKLTQEQLDLKRQLYEQQKQKQKTNPDDQNSLQVPPRYPSTETSSQEIARERSQQRIKSIAREPGNIVQEEEAVDAEVEIEETIDDSGFAEHPVLQAQIENYLERTKSSRPGGAAVNNRTRSTSGSTQLSPELQSRRQGNRPAVSLRSGSNNTSTASNAQSTTSTSKTDPKAAWLKRVEAQRKATREALNTATRIESSEPAQEQVIVSSTDQVKYEEPTRTAPSTDQVSQRYVELSVAEPQTVDSQEIMSDMAVDDVEATRIKAENIQSYKKLSANLAESIAKAHLQTIREESKVTPQGEPALAADSLVLVELYQRTDGDNWNSNNGWLVEPVENWHGISLDGNGRVRRINLSYNNLVDSMPSSLGQLDALEELHLQGNLFMGGIPSSFGDMVNLRQLHFSDNNLSGTLPLELFNLTNLTDLDISSNNFFGNFPVEIGNLVNLIFLRLSNNNFFGTLPAELGQLPSLDYLDFSSNNFSGEIPSSFSGLSNLRSLHAWNNNLNGSFPSVIYTMTSLEFLDLGGNLLEDTLSAAIGNLTNLRSFQIYDNNIGGNLPPELGSLSNLDNINASGNEFSGPIPIELGNLINLRWLYLSDNNLSGTLPIELGSLLQLNAIELGFNDFTGQIPLELGQLPNLSQLNLGYNELTGSIPVEFNNLGQLNFLNVDNNNLTTIEFDPSSLTNLNSLNLSNNFFPFSELEPIYQTFGGFIDNYDTKIGDNEPDTALFLESGSIIIDAGVPGSFNTYMWYLDEIPTGAVSSSITASVPGKYRCEVSNSLVTEYIINSRSFLVWDGAGGNATDSSALVDLYNQTDGANWNQNQNWLITPIQFWYGVTTDTTGRVTGIAMNGNNLNGRLPASIDNMDSLQSLQLTDNKIVGVDFDPLLLPSTTTVDLGFNQLDYSELAKFGGVSANVFLNQSKPFSKEDTTITKFAGSTVDLFAGTSDASYDYWWYRDGLLYDTLSGSTLTVSDAGVSYFCEIFDDTVFPTYGYFILSRAFQINDLPISDVSDSLALVAIYNDMGGSAWLDNTGWLTDPVANWYGVSLDVDGRVDNLSLSNNNLIGDLSTAVGDLDSLTFLNMGSNIITGQLPASLFNLPKINFIYLYDNLLSGELPAALGNLTTLTHLQLNNNQLSGSIPIEVGNMTALFSLFLSSNGLSGSIPSQLSNLPSLTELYLDNNNLTGNIPPELGLLNNLFTISVGDNNLSGTLPIELGNIDNLSNINIYNNQFTGTIPAEYDSLSNLSTISAWENRLNGFDADPSNWSFFSSLDINNNDYRFDVLEQLVSSLPLGLNASSQSKISNDTSFTALASDNVMLIATTPGTQNNYEWFRFGGSYGVFNDTLVVTESGEYYCRITNDIVTPAIGTELFTGNFDITIEIVADMADSLALVATYQNMGGTSWFNQGGWLGSKVVDWYGVVLNDAGKVIQLDLNNNNLTGNLAPGIFQFDELRELNLSGNQITGAIPAAIGNLPQLEILDLGFNQLTGSIPIEISQDTLLRWLYLWYNPLTGSLTPELAMLPNLEELILDNCDLSGSIDAAFGNQSSLWSFRVGGNNFDGAIPATFSTLPNLQFLGIQDNNFTSLPDLSTVTSLQALTAYGNLLEFDDFEPLIGSSAVLSIDPQQIIGSTTIEVPGSLVTLDATVGGSANNYQWYFDGMAIDSANDAQYTIANMQLDSAGFYMCEISNDSITPSTNLRLFRDFNVFITLPVANSDSLALVDFYEATQGQEWSDANNWLQAPVAMWEGVTLFDSRVIALDLSRPATSIQKRGLRGGIPPSIADLDSLEWLDLQGNDLSYVSGEFFSLPKLSYLDLSDNRFEGKLSPSIGKMTTLNNLYLGRNDWSGGIPAELFDLVNLRLLSLDAGGFEGRLPASIGNMTKLEALFLNNLELIGDLPSEMGQLGKLETLSLSNTPFTGSLPTEIGNLDSLKVLSITNSPLIGDSLPPAIGNLTNLEALFLSGSDFSSGFPDELWTLTNLKTLTCTSCQLQEPIPSEIGNLTKLESLGLTANNIPGAVPATLPVDSLRFLFLGSNDIDALPDLSGASNLELLAIGGNRLDFSDLAPVSSFLVSTGQIVGNMKPVTPDTLILLPEGDSISFIVPNTGADQVKWIVNGVDVGVTSDTLTISSAINPDNDGQYYAELTNSSITPFVGLTLNTGFTNLNVIGAVSSADSLVLVDLYNDAGGADWFASNWLTGPVDTWSGIAVQGGRVVSIGLGGANLVGTLPSSLADLDALESLSIVENPELTGDIPANIFNITSLVHVDLGRNGFTGSIPSNVGNATNLQFLGLAGNNLSGSIPVGIGNLTQLTDLYLDDNLLTGPIPVEVLNLTNISGFSVDRNFLTEIPAFIDTTFTSTFYVNFDFNYFDFEDLLRTEFIPGNAKEGTQDFRYPLSITSGPVVEGGPVTLAVSGTLPDDNVEWWYVTPEQDMLFLQNTGTDTTYTISAYDSDQEGLYYATVSNPNFDQSEYRISSEVVAVTTNEVTFASEADAPIFDIKFGPDQMTGVPDLIPFDDRSSRHYKYETFDNITLSYKFDTPVSFNYFRLLGEPSNFTVRELIVFNGGVADTVVAPFSFFREEVGPKLKTGTSLTQVDSLQMFTQGFFRIDAIEIGDDGVDPTIELFPGQVGEDFIGFLVETDLFGDKTIVIERSLQPDTGFVEINTIDFEGFYRDETVPFAGVFYYRAKLVTDEFTILSNTLKTGNCFGTIPDNSVWFGQSEAIFAGDTSQGTRVEIFINRTDDWNQYYISDFTAGWYDQFGQFQTDGQFSQLCDEIVGTFGSQAEIVGGIFQNDTLYIDWIDQANGIVGTSQLTLIRIEGGGPGMVELRPPDDIELGLGSSTTVVLNWEYYDINDSQQTISADQAFENESRIQSVNDSRSPEPEADHTLGIDKFIIQRSVGDETNYADYAEVGGDTTVFFDNNELDGQLYFYRVYASINDTLSYPSIENCIEHKAPLFDPVVNTNFTQTPGTARGASWVDYNNDGFDDIVIYGLSNNEVYENNGDGSFEFKENALTRDRFITSFNAAWADYDNDGFIDVYVPGIAAAEGSVEEASDKLFRNLGGGAFEEVNQAFFSQSKTQYTPIWIDLENDGNIDLITGNQGIIYHNNGDGTFTAGDTLATLMADGSFITLSPRVVDVDSDGDMDISVNPNNTNDAYTLFINDGFGQFTTSTIDAIFGDFVPFKTSIGQSWADYDNDGDQDLFIGDFVTALYENLGNLQFERIPVEQLVPGVIADELITDSYYTWADFDNDGWKDIIWNFRDDGNRVLLNNRNKTFRLLPEEEQLFEFTEATKSISVSDFNNDGYPDFFLGSSDPEEPNQLFKANPGTNNWIKIRLQGVTSNRSGLGTQVRVKSAGQWQYDQANNYNGRGAGNGMALIFGLGTATVVDSIVVDWPSGDATVVTGTASNQILTISERIPVSQSDSLALVSLYESTGGATDWLSQGGWLELPAREWQGTFFNEEGRLTGLVLGNNNLTGKIPVEVTTLDQLEAFDLANNQLEGIIPDSLNRMIALRSINLSNNNLSGGIPLKIGEIPGLVNINFSNNQLQGLLPSSINDLSGLVELNLANNQMIGFLPAQIGGLTELLILNLGNNDFEGTIPISFGNLSKVEELALNNNDLTGRIPGTFGNLNPVIFDAAGNALSGTLPNGLSNWSRVDVINLAENDLTGSLQSIVALDSVSQIFVNDNRFRQLPEVLVSRLDTISAINNWLDFEAFEANELLSGELIALDPQDSLFRKRDTLHQVGVPIEFQYPIGGSANVYQWFKDGLAIDGATDSLISLQTPDFDDEGFYHLQVTSTLVPDVTLTTNTIELKLTSLARDRAALTAFFNATNTPADPANRWINSTNWDSNESLDTWDGVDVANDRVIRLSLPNNNIDGFVPDIFAELNGLQEINLAGNELRSFPDVSDFESLTILRLDSNRLGFADLLPHREVTGFEYSPQRRFDRTVTDTIPAGENYVLEVNMEGEGNVFTWYFQSLQDVIEDIPAEPALDGNSPKYLVNEIDFFDMGVYYAEVTNPDLPDLTIRSRNRNVFAKTEIFGRIVDQDSISLTRGEITLFRQLPRGPYDSTSTVAINGAGEYGFEAAVLGNFILRVVPDLLDTTDFLQTYYIQQNDWLQADTLKLRDRTEGIDIVMISNPGADFDPGLGGTGRISGTLEADLTEEDIVGEDSTARVEARRRVRRAGCSLSKRRSSGRPLEDIYDLVAYTETDDEGKFSFGFIPDGEYRINIQYPGVPMDSTTAIDFVVGAGGTVEDNEFTLEATITEEGIQVDVLEELGRLKPFLKNVKLYPNPTEGRLVMDYLVYRKIADLSATLHTASGKVMLEQQLDHRLGSKQVVIDMEAFESGFYFLTLTDEAKTFKHTIKVTKK